MVLKLYAVSDGPPSLSVRQLLKKLEIPFELINVDFGRGDHMTTEYAKMNPQKEIPVLDDDGLYLGESNAILQYICDKYKPNSDIYPQDPKSRALVNHRLCFNLSTYYANISAYTMAPIFFDYERTDFGLKKVHMALEVFEIYLARLGTSHAAANHLTIADLQLFNSTMTLEAIDFDFSKYEKNMVLKLYAVSDGPPSLSVRQLLKKLEIPFELINVDFGRGDHMTTEYAKMNPQKEIPVLDDDGLYLGESNAILQYICDKYKPNSDIYPQDPKSRALVNHRLCFNLSTYYANISAYTMAPIFFDYERTDFGLKKVHMALEVFEIYLARLGTSHAAANHLTIADLQLFNSTMTLEAIDFDFSKYEKIFKWYNAFKQNYPDLWKISEDAMKEIQNFIENPPDLTHLNHPIHPARKINKNL